MDHRQFRTIPGVSAKEPTAVTMKSIKELIAEEEAAKAKAGEMARPTIRPTVGVPPASFREAIAAMPPASASADIQAPAPRRRGSLFSRIIGR